MADNRSLYTFNPIPDSEIKSSVLAINQSLEQIDSSFRELNNMHLNKSYKEPDKLIDGMIVRADGVDWNPGSGKGVYLYDEDDGWVKLG